MSPEIISVDLFADGGKVILSELLVYEEAPDDKEKVLLEIYFNNRKISKKGDYLFSALLELRKALEEENFLIQCNGAARNVYPSPMQMSMGGAKAYVLRYSQPAKLKDVINIFEKNDELVCVHIKEQERFYVDWLKSIRDK